MTQSKVLEQMLTLSRPTLGKQRWLKWSRHERKVQICMNDETDVIIVGAGLAGLVAAAELVDAGRRVIILEQEPEASLGGQAFWSFGGLFLVNSPEQRRLGIRDSHDLALQDWMGSAGFDREEDLWPRRWAEAYVDFASGEKVCLAAWAGHSPLSGRVAGRAVSLAVI